MKEVRRGFTLIELLVVIAIIALLSSVVLASLSTARMKSRDAKRITDLHNIKIALEMYYDSNGEYPNVMGQAQNTNTYSYSSAAASWSDLAAKLKPYIDPLPKDPINNNTSPWINGRYSYSYGNVGNGGVSVANPDGVVWYDLVTQLETPKHSLSCWNTQNSYHYAFKPTQSWCTSYSKQMYADTPF